MCSPVNGGGGAAPQRMHWSDCGGVRWMVMPDEPSTQRTEKGLEIPIPTARRVLQDFGQGHEGDAARSR